jgi:hypothetical protein
MVKYKNIIAKLIFHLQILLIQLEDLMAKKFFSFRIKNIVKMLISELQKVEQKEYDRCFDEQEHATKVIYDTYENGLRFFASVPVQDVEVIESLYVAYLQDPKSMGGIANKILKNKK